MAKFAKIHGQQSSTSCNEKNYYHFQRKPDSKLNRNKEKEKSEKGKKERKGNDLDNRYAKILNDQYYISLYSNNNNVALAATDKKVQ